MTTSRPARWIGALCAFGPALLGAQATRDTAVVLPPTVTIVGDDYAFVQPPTTLPAGLRLFAFENRGKVRHEMDVALLRPGVTLEEVARLAGEGGKWQPLLNGVMGLLIVAPGRTAGGRLLVDLLPGRTYLLVCTLKDSPEAKPHAEMGMLAAIQVK